MRKKLTPGNIVRAIRNRLVANIGDAKAYWHYRNVDYARLEGSSIPSSLLSTSVTDYLRDALREKKLARYFADVEAELRQDPQLFSQHIDISDKILSGQLLTYDWQVDLGDPPEWNVDITGSGTWPKMFFKRYRKLYRQREKYGDSRFNWELNRQQHLVGLALAQSLTNDEKYAAGVVNHILSWIEKNPAFYSINWTSSMEVGLRLVTWCLSLAQLSSPGISQADQERIVFSIYQHVKFLSENLSSDLSDSGSDTKLKNNHTIVELSALIVALELFPMLADAGRSQADLLDALLVELERQTYPDGMQVEQASSYLRFVAEAVLVTRLVVDESEGLDDYIDGYLQALAAFQCGEETILVIGDEDNGHVLIPYYESRPESLRVVLGMYETFIHGRDGELDGETPSPKIAPWRTLSESTSVLRDSGHWHSRHRIGDDKLSLYFRAGRMDFPLIPEYAPHAHCDLLSFVIAINSQPWFVDRGTYSYKLRDISDELRLSGAHNTIMIDGFEQMRILGPFHNDRQATGRLIDAGEYSVTGEMILVNGDRTVTVVRKISLNPEKARIEFHDVISGIFSEGVTWLFNLHPDVEQSDDGWLSKDPKLPQFILEGFNNMETKAVGYSPRYGVLENSMQLWSRDENVVSGKIEKKWSIAYKY
jgi:Heparinase II/III-like protein/Heparinase II/III N-terminus